MPTQINLNSEQDTISLAQSIAPYINRNAIILLYGPLGSGKTFFAKQLCAFLGVTETTNSPSFVLINRYQAKSFPIYHIDLYRLQDEEEAFQLGIEDFIDEGVVIIEWPQLLEPLFDNLVSNAPSTTDYQAKYSVLKIEFSYNGENRTALVSSTRSKIEQII